MSEYRYFYVVREDTRTLLDILPRHLYTYDSNMLVRQRYALLQKCSTASISLVKEKSRTKHYKGIL